MERLYRTFDLRIFILFCSFFICLETSCVITRSLPSFEICLIGLFIVIG